MTVAIIVAGCGSSAKPQAQIVAGTGFRFAAPAGWKVQSSHSSATAGQGESRFVRVSVFQVARAYTPKLFAKVARDVGARMTALAKQTGGTVAGTGVATPDGIKSHVWRIKTGDSLDEYTFVLTGRLEYELLCHRPAGADDAPCTQLVSTFHLT